MHSVTHNEDDAFNEIIFQASILTFYKNNYSKDFAGWNLVNDAV